MSVSCPALHKVVVVGTLALMGCSVAPVNAAGSAEQTDIGQINSASELRGALSEGLNETEFLPVDEAFRLRVSVNAAGAVVAAFRISDGYYLYRDKIRLRGAGLSRYALPSGELKHDRIFGETSVLRDSFSTTLTVAPQLAGSDIVVNANYQGCADDGICYPPVKKTFRLSLPPAGQALRR